MILLYLIRFFLNTYGIIYEAFQLLKTGILCTIKKIYKFHFNKKFLFIDVRLIRLNLYRFYDIHEDLAVRMQTRIPYFSTTTVPRP